MLEIVKSSYIKLADRFPRTREAFYLIESCLGFIYKKYRPKDEWGACIQCGRFSRFKYVQLLDTNSDIAQSCRWDESFIEVINATNTLSCTFCNSKFRIRCASKSLLDNLNLRSYKSINQLYQHCKNGKTYLDILETASIGGIFSEYDDWEGLVKTEFLDNLDRGEYRNNIRSEDLRKLTFSDNTFDLVVVLDVLEHVSDPWNALSEIERVLKPKGIAIITVPIDLRNQHTRVLATEENGTIRYLTIPAYHADPIRDKGSLVFTDFGTDIVGLLTGKGFNVYMNEYRTQRNQISQFVIVMKKKESKREL